eukprot:scaffold766_cov179-Amphora_coffeaeformis.AAC.11
MPRIRNGSVGSYVLVALLSAMVTWSFSSLASSLLMESSREDMMLLDSGRIDRMLDPSSPVIVDKQATRVRDRPKQQHQPPPRSDIYRKWSIFNHPFPCYPGSIYLMSTKPAHKGILFQRPMKVGSTTMVGIILRLAHSKSPWMDRNIKCEHRTNHGTALSYDYGNRDRSQSFLLGLVRDPTKRAISEFFHFGVSANDISPTDGEFKAYLRVKKTMNYLMNDLRTRNYTDDYTEELLEDLFYEMKGITNDEYERIMENAPMQESMLLRRDWEEFLQHGPGVDHAKVVRDILKDYDFIAVTERLDESLVVMQMLLNLSTRDILYNRARSSGSFSVGTKKKPCHYIVPSFVSPRMAEYFESEEWKRTIQGDQLLYDSVNESLDRTIDALGRDLFTEKLKEFRAILEKAQAHCKGRVRTLCSEGGERQDSDTTCYIWGEGCDYECLNDFVF